MTMSEPQSPNIAGAAQILLNTIRRPVIMVDPDGFISFANADAEDFFRSSAATLARNTLSKLIPFGSPLLTHTLFGAYVGLLVWGGLWLREPRLRTLLPLKN